MSKIRLTASVCAAVALLALNPAQAGPAGHGKHTDLGGHEGHGAHAHTFSLSVGEPGDPADARRVKRVVMNDNTYAPKSITVSKGETVHFLIFNKGEFVHEFNIGTAKMHRAHQAEMLSMMESGALEADRIVHEKMGAMKHDDPNSVLLEPGQKGEIVWKFSEAGEIQFACNVPGHYEDGMHGRLRIR